MLCGTGPTPSLGAGEPALFISLAQLRCRGGRGGFTRSAGFEFWSCFHFCSRVSVSLWLSLSLHREACKRASGLPDVTRSVCLLPLFPCNPVSVGQVTPSPKWHFSSCGTPCMREICFTAGLGVRCTVH